MPDIWEFDGWKIITTNGVVKANGEAVMGAGLALQAKQRYPGLPKRLAIRLREWGNIPHYFELYNIITFPTKHNWRSDSDLTLIRQSCVLLRDQIDHFPAVYNKIAMPRVGCANGNLDWDVVKPIIEKELGNYIQSGVIVYV